MSDLVGGAVVGTGVGFGASGGSAALGDIIDASRYINSPVGIITPDVTIEEHHSDGLAITEHPVEIGAAITDHSFKRPSEVTMKLGWSNSSPNAGSETYVREVYAKLLAAQNARQPMSVVTGKRTYNSMLIAELNLRTDAATEYALMIDAVFREIILVSTQAAAVPPQDAQASPSSGTSPVVDQGTQTPVATNTPVNSSGLNSIAGLLGG